MADEGSWRTSTFRQSVVSKIDEAIRQSAVPTARNSIEMENHVYQKAKTKEEYLGFVARLILHVREMKQNIQKRWRSLRDSFIRSYRKMHKPGGLAAFNKKRYIYYDQMKFIIPIAGKLRKRKRYKDHSSDSNQNEAFEEINFEECMEEENTPYQLKEASLDTELFSILNNPAEPSTTETVEDEDKLFLMSLVPSFKKMDDDSKFDARIEIMKVIRYCISKTNAKINTQIPEAPSQSASSSPSGCFSSIKIDKTDILPFE